VRWGPLCLAIRDDYGAAPTVPAERRDLVIAAHELSHRMLRVIEAAREAEGDEVVEPVYAAWGKRFFGGSERDEALLTDVVTSCGLDTELLRAADEEKWDDPIVAAMDIAYSFGG